MARYLNIIKISLKQEAAYRWNFIMWRLRNLMQVFLVFFLWETAFSQNRETLFGYSKAQMLTYVFGLLIVKSFVTSSRSIDVVGEIADGRFTNYLLKPISYIRYWFARDIAAKSLNIGLSIIELTILLVLLKPPFFLQTNIYYLILFILSLGLAIVLFFVLLFLISLFTFWYTEQAWGFPFLLMIFVDFLGGGIFPLDILPPKVTSFLSFLPFPYLLYIPLQTYLGQLTIPEATKSIVISFAWVLVLTFLLKKMWIRGVKVYKAEGR